MFNQESQNRKRVKFFAFIALITGVFLSAPPAFALANYGYLGFCVYKDVPNTSGEPEIYTFNTNGDSNCMDDGQNLVYTVTIPVDAPASIYCSKETHTIKENMCFGCLSQTSYVTATLKGKGGGASVSTSGKLRFYGPADYNELYFEDGMDPSVHLCHGKGDCSSTDIEFHNHQHVYVVYSGDR